MIKKIIIEVGGKEIELTPKQAKKLYDELGELYSKGKEYVPYWRWYPSYPYTSSYWIDDGTATFTITTGDANTDISTGDCPQNAGVTFTS